MKNDYIRMFICVVIMNIVLIVLMKIDNKSVEYNSTTKKYKVYKKTIDDKDRNSYRIKCLDSNDDMVTLYIEQIPNVTNVNTKAFYDYIKEEQYYEFTTICHRRAYGAFPNMYIIGVADANNKRKDDKQ